MNRLPESLCTVILSEFVSKDWHKLLSVNIANLNKMIVGGGGQEGRQGILCADSLVQDSAWSADQQP